MSKTPLKERDNLRFVEDGQRIVVDEEPQDRCCCNVHVETGAKVIALIGLMACCLNFLSNIINNASPFTNVGALLGLCIYAAIIMAGRTRNPGLYWPFLIMNGLAIVLSSIAIVMIGAAVLIESFDKSTDYSGYYANHGGGGNFRGLLFLIVVFLILHTVLNIWFQSIVYAAYRYMRREQQQEVPGSYVIQQQQYVSP